MKKIIKQIFVAILFLTISGNNCFCKIGPGNPETLRVPDINMTETEFRNMIQQFLQQECLHALNEIEKKLFITSLYFGDFNIASDFLNRTGITPNEISINNIPILSFFIKGGQKRAVEFLLNHGIFVRTLDQYGNNPFHYASKHGDPNILIPLIEKLKDLENDILRQELQRSNQKKETPLSIAKNERIRTIITNANQQSFD